MTYGAFGSGVKEVEGGSRARPVPHRGYRPRIGYGVTLLPRHDEGVGAHRGYLIGVRYDGLGEWAGGSFASLEDDRKGGSRMT